MFLYMALLGTANGIIITEAVKQTSIICTIAKNQTYYYCNL